ncbi:kinase-like domain-containing protein [Aspergillus affinis]|uniref:kinase-like domain-containing protein n=1 Tax=Aspergillus affinis TaxID=1070780 RepID=UPI0022FE694B|nr:kinase-like domain-containing protein [Aspergillus affinis]KAI9046015.1 kinase-like domain-containing protein [Aspergillus affinis]
MIKGTISVTARRLSKTDLVIFSNEEQELRDRYTPFNVLELQRIAARSVDTIECTAIAKLAEGSFNKAFRLTMDSAMTMIARIPHPIAGPNFYTTAPEVATMEFARTVLGIPTPEVYAWSANRENPVGSEYIIMQEAPGVKLEDVWYGSLYFATGNVSGAVAAEVIGDVPAAVKDNANWRFSIGPVVAREYWNKERAMMKPDRRSYPNDRYEDAVVLFTELRETRLRTMIGKEREEFERQTEWIETSLVVKKHMATTTHHYYGPSSDYEAEAEVAPDRIEQPRTDT